MDVNAAHERVKQFVEARKQVRGMDPDEIAVLNPGGEKEAVLTITDLEHLLALVAPAVASAAP